MDIRVHGNKKIRRSENIQSSNNYLIYKEQLVKDFRDLCGYCGKNRNYFFDNFQIDHFRPKSKYPDLKNDYNNLVLSCPICNRNKSDDWPTNDKNVYHNDSIGYVDPASKEFDKVFYRDEDGNICSNYDYGKYMITKLKFDIRPIKELWKLERLYQAKKNINQKIKQGKISMDEYRDFYEISNEIDELTRFLKYEEGE